MKNLFELIARSRNPQFRIWKQALAFVTVKKTVLEFLNCEYPKLVNHYNLEEIIKIYLNFNTLLKITITFKINLTPLLIIFKQREEELKDIINEALIANNLIGSSSKIVLVFKN